jgi:hypothetical protein
MRNIRFELPIVLKALDYSTFGSCQCAICKSVNFHFVSQNSNPLLILQKMNATQLSRIPTRKKINWALVSGRDKERSHRRKPLQHSKMFLPGQPVLESGIYEVIHDKSHREAHEAVMYRDDLFPVCDQCDLKVRFKLIRSAPYIFDDEDFAKE